VAHQTGKPTSAHEKCVGALWAKTGLASQGQCDGGVDLAAVGLACRPSSGVAPLVTVMGRRPQHGGYLGCASRQTERMRAGWSNPRLRQPAAASSEAAS